MNTWQVVAWNAQWWKHKSACIFTYKITDKEIGVTIVGNKNGHFGDVVIFRLPQTLEDTDRYEKKFTKWPPW